MENHGLYLTPFQHKLLLKSLEADLRPEYRRRIEIMLLADQGQSQTQICQALGCSQETARYWIVIAKTGMAHCWNDRTIGRPKTVNQQYCDRLKQLVSHSPREYGYGFQHWTAQWLAKHLAKELEINVSSCHINRLLKEMGLSTRPKDNIEKVTEITQDSSIKIQDLSQGSLYTQGKPAYAATLHNALPSSSSRLVPQGGIQNSKFKIHALIQRKRFIDLEWVVYLRRVVLVSCNVHDY